MPFTSFNVLIKLFSLFYYLFNKLHWISLGSGTEEGP